MCEQCVIEFDAGYFIYVVSLLARLMNHEMYPLMALYRHQPTLLIGEACCFGYTALAVASVFQRAP